MLEISSGEHLQESSEQDRLDALRGYCIAGTEAEPRFDAITRTAGALLKTPMAFLTLIEENRQWFKSAIGFEVQQTPRAGSFCTHTIMGSDVMVISDASLDARFVDSPLVAGQPGVRFYAGAPLVTENGLRLGALCVADTVPREFSKEERGALKDLAALAMNQIAARRSEFSTLALAGLAQSLGQPLIAVGRNGVIDFANRPAAEFFGRALGDLKGRRMDDVISSGRLGMDADRLISIFENAQTGVVSRPFLRVATKADGAEVPVEISVSRWDAVTGTGIAVVLGDLAEKAGGGLATFKERRRELAAGDDGDIALSRFLDVSLQEGRQVGLFLLALDGFEELCSSLGRNVANMVLTSVTNRLQQLLPQAAIIARAKADDFAIIVEGIATQADACRIADQIARSFDEAFDLGVRPLQATASIGFAIGLVHGSRASELVANAAFALSEVRRAGGRGVQIYDPALRIRANERYQVQRELMQAVKNGEFRLFYQPQVSLADGHVLGVEALIRWQHPTRGLLLPKDFLLDVEEGPLSLSIGWWTLDTACAQLAAWRAEGLPKMRIGVNLFSAQFCSDQLVEHIAGLLEHHGLEPDMLELEVTETIALLNDEGGLTSFRQLREMGVRIAFDDFGTGYASLSSLQQFPLTTLKLDRGFIRNILTNPSDAVITRSMIAMANDLNLSTIAEGVETAEQEAFLRKLGCEIGQGYLYSKPTSADEMTAMLGRESGACEHQPTAQIAAG